MPTLTLESTVNVSWEDRKGCDRDCDVEVKYTYDGADDLRILSGSCIGDDSSIGQWEFDELLHEAVLEVAGDAYDTWLADQDAECVA